MNRPARPLLLAALLAAAPAPAAGPGAGEPVRLRAERIELDQRSGVSRYQGRVVLTHGTLRLTADRAEVRAGREAIEQVRTDGRPVSFRYLPEGHTQMVEGEAQRADYDLVARRLELRGAVELRQGRHLVRAASIRYDLATEVVTAEAGSDQRVYVALAPRPRAGAGPEPAP